MEVSDQLHALAALPPGKKPLVPMNKNILEAFTAMIFRVLLSCEAV
jgi:hypothetical protein